MLSHEVVSKTLGLALILILRQWSALFVCSAFWGLDWLIKWVWSPVPPAIVAVEWLLFGLVVVFLLRVVVFQTIADQYRWFRWFKQVRKSNTR